ncbi:hypothetical protein SteCoe_11381 [Stentor coeruleus]|uniref:Uncharacterized protein n=1 Tax=Stentor coeruleus TaxID=5963 RepID=A0A1R2CD82_9CILI|nr:hypothetical protein SteCoe_11381 [Stentor coeruleus]
MSGLNQPLLEGNKDESKPLSLSAPTNEAIKPVETLNKSGLQDSFKEIKDSVDNTFKYKIQELPFHCEHIKISSKHHLLIGSSTQESSIAIKDLHGKSEIRIVKTTLGSISCIRLNKDETTIYFGTDDGKIAIYEFPSLNPETIIIIDVGRGNVFFDVLTNDIYAYDTYNETFNVIDVESKKISIISDVEGAHYVRISPDEKLVAISSSEYVTVYNKELKWKEFVYKIKVKEDENEDDEYYDYEECYFQSKCEVEFCNKSNVIAISYENYIELWDLNTGLCLKTLKLHTESDITSFKFSEDDSLLAAVGIDHSINIWDLTLNSSLPKFLNHPIEELNENEALSNAPVFYDLEIDESRNLIYTHALDSNRSFQWKGIFIDKAKFPKSKFQKHAQRCIVSKSQNHVLVTDANNHKLFIWDIETKAIITTIELTQTPWEVSFGEENENFLYICHDSVVREYNGQTYSFIREIPCEQAGSIYVIRTCGEFIFVGGKAGIVFILNRQGAVVDKIVGYNESVSGMKVCKSKNLLITGDFKGHIFVHEIGTWVERAHLIQHHRMIRTIEIFANQDTMITVAHDNKCIFWSIYDKTHIKIIHLHSQIDSCYLSKDERSFILSTVEGDVNIYNLPSFNLMMTMRYKSSLQRFAVDIDEKYLLVSNNLGVFRTLSPVALNNPLIIDTNIHIPNLRLFLNGKKKKNTSNDTSNNTSNVTSNNTSNDISNDTWIIAPYMVNSLHYYANDNIKKSLKKAMIGGSFYLKSSLGTPLDIALLRDSTEAAGAILGQLKIRVASNNYALETLSDVLCKLNREGFKGLDELYNECLIESPEKLQDSCVDEISLPIVTYALTMKVNQEQFLGPQPAEGPKRISFLVSTIRMNLETGSQESLDFLNSLLESSNTEIFKTKFIQTILFDKWKKIKWIPHLNGLLFVFYLVSLSVYIVTRDPLYLLIALVWNILTFLYEVMQMFIDFVGYWKDPWNYIDISRAGFFYAYFYFGYIALEIVTETYPNGETLDKNSSDDYTWILVLVTILSWIRGITLFALFSSTRYMVSLLGEVIKDIIAFAVVVFYSILSFAFIKMSYPGTSDSNDTSKGLGILIIDSYFEAIGGGESTSEGFTLVLVIVNSIFNVIIMMNLLISILGTTYGRVNDEAEVADLVELTEMIIEAESLYYHRRGEKKKSVLQICEEYTPPEIVPAVDIKMKYRTVKNEIASLKERNSEFFKTCNQKFENLYSRHSDTQMKMENNKKDIISELKNGGDELKKQVKAQADKNKAQEGEGESEEAAIKKLFVCLNKHSLKPKIEDGHFCNICRDDLDGQEMGSCNLCNFDMCFNCARFYYDSRDKQVEVQCCEGHTLLHIDELNAYLESHNTQNNLTCRFCNEIVVTEAFCCIPCLFVMCTNCSDSYTKAHKNKNISLKCLKSHDLNWKHKELYKENLKMTCTKCKHLRIGSGFFTCSECPSNWCLKCVKEVFLTEASQE